MERRHIQKDIQNQIHKKTCTKAKGVLNGVVALNLKIRASPKHKNQSYVFAEKINHVEVTLVKVMKQLVARVPVVEVIRAEESGAERPRRNGRARDDLR